MVRYGDPHFAIHRGRGPAPGGHDRNRRRDPQRELRHDRQLDPLFAFELLPFVAELDRAMKCNSAPPAVSVNDARNGVGRNGRPNGASGSNS